MRVFATIQICTILFFAPGPATSSLADERAQSFDKDPGWEGINNRILAPRKVRQDFGYSPTNHAGLAAGEIGGFITPAAEPAYYGKRISPSSFADTLSASGTLICTGRKFHALIGFFNSKTVNEWRTPNTIALRVQGRGNCFYAYLEYTTQRWRAGGDSPQGFTLRDPSTGKRKMREFTLGEKHSWSLEYDPRGNNGAGSVAARIDGEEAVCHLDPSHKSDGASFNRFGLLNIVKSVDDGGELWLDGIAVGGDRENFDRDPRWEGFQNRREYTTSDIRPHFDFGYSRTNFAGGKAAGEMGGLVFRGDGRYKEKMACYGDRLEALTLDKPLRAAGKVALRRGVSDSTVLIGFYHSADSMRIYDAQDAGTPPGFLGAAIEGPSSEGFFLYPACHLQFSSPRDGRRNDPPRILPDGTSHTWALDYDPSGSNGLGEITITMDGKSARLAIQPGDRSAGIRFNRFGIITTRIDGNAQRVYFDDLSYTFRQN